MKKSKMILAMMLLLFSGVISLSAQNEKFKALFVYNFIKNVEWPPASKQGDLIIGVLGSNPISKELETITNTQRAGSQSMKVKVFASVDEISNCQLIYVSPNKTALIPQVVAKLNGSNTLIISDGRGAIQHGSAINFLMDGDKLKFEIKKQNIEQKGLKVSEPSVRRSYDCGQ